jgi:hypothetical protein
MTDLLVERDAELALLREVVTDLTAGRSAFVEITGPPGYGHTALLRHAIGLAVADGVRVLHATGGASYGIANDVTTHFVSALGLDAVGWGPSAVVVLSQNMLALARQRPLMVVLDDAQWMGERSRQWLRATLRRLEWAPMLVLVATSGLGTAAESLTQELATEASVADANRHVLRLRPLTRDGVKAMTRTLDGGPLHDGLVAALAQHTLGMPSVVRATLRAVGASSVTLESDLVACAVDARSDWVARVLRVLATAPTTLARVAAVCGTDFDWHLLCELARLQPAAAVRAGAVLRRLGLAESVPDETQIRLAGPPVAERVLAEMSPVAREALHRKAFELGARAGVAPARLSEVLLSVPPGVPGAVRILRDEARRLRAEDRPAAAARLLERALREPEIEAEQVGLVMELAETEAGFAPDASDRRLVGMLLGRPGPETRLRAADMLVMRGRPAVVQRTIMTAAGPLREDERAVLSALYWIAEDTVSGVSEGTVRGMPPLPETPGDPAGAGVAAWLVTIQGRDRARALSLARAALAVPARYDGPLSPRVLACSSLLLAGEAEETKEGIDAVLVDARRSGVQAAAVWAMLLRGALNVLQERWDDAAQDIDRLAHELPERCWHPMVSGHVRALAVSVHLSRGMPDEARRYMARPLAPGVEHSIGWAHALFADGLMLLVDGEPAAALERFLECGRRMLAQQWVNPVLLSWRLLAGITQSALDRPAEARRLVRDEYALAETWGAPVYLARVRSLAANLLESR